MTRESTSRLAVNFDKIIRRLIPFILLGVAGNLAYSFFTTDWTRFQVAVRLSPAWLVSAMLLSLLPWGWHVLRLHIWTRFFGQKISLKNLLRIVVATDVGGAVTPTAVGGAPLKLLMLVNHGLRPGQATLLTLLGNLEDVLFYAILIPVSLFLTKNWEHPLWGKMSSFIGKFGWKALAAILLLLLIGLIFRRLFKKNKKTPAWQVKLRRLAIEFREAWQLIRSSGRKPFLLSMLALTAQWLTRFSVLIAVLFALEIEADYFRMFWLQWMVFAAILLVPTPGGAGGAEAAFLLVFGTMLQDGTAAVVMAVWRLLTYYFMLVVGVGILAWRKHSVRG
jgi:glycosyltransferase 2 family protein